MFRFSLKRTVKSDTKKKSITQKRLFTILSAPPTKQFILLIFGFVFLTLYLFLKNDKGQKLLETTFTQLNYQRETPEAQIIEDYTLANEPVRVDSKLTDKQLVIDKPNPPHRIIIPSVSIDLPVLTSPVIQGYWKVYPDKAGFGDGSSFPGLKGNTVIFAHARIGLFLGLKNVKLNDTVYVLTKNEWMSYKVRDIKTVFPDNLNVIAPTPDETLTLFTCSGFADSTRLIVTAKRI